MNRNKLIIFLLMGIFVIIGIIFLGFSKGAISSDKLSVNEDLIARQESMDLKIKEYRESDIYTIDNPKIIENPYEISPLTALIIFKTETKQNIKVFLNNKELLTTNNELEKVIPITGLVANKENTIILNDGKNKYEYKIKPEINLENPLKVNVKGKEDNSYFISSSSTPLAFSAFNGLGEMNFHLSLASQGELEFIDANTFIVPAEEYVTKDGISLYTSLYVVDYLGKIIKRIDSEYGYHHDIEYLGDGTALVLGSEDDHSMSIIYRMNISTGQILDYVDLDNVFTKVDPKWDGKNLKWGYGINSIDYDVTTDNILISSRNLNLVMSLNYTTKEINWMYTDEEEFANFSEYLLRPLNNLGYPLGQHEALFVNANTISVYNNNFDEKNRDGDNVVSNQNPATALILKIDETYKTISTYKSFSEENKYSYALGGFKTYQDSNVVSYSYLFKDAAIKNNVSLYAYQDNTYSRIVEYDNLSNIIFDATIEDRIYRVNIYNQKPTYQNYVIKKYQYISNISVPEDMYEDWDFDKIETHDNILKIYKNHYEVTLDEKMIDDLIVILKGAKEYAIPYIGTGTYFNVESGTYALYIKLNGKFYNLEKNVKF